MIKEAKPYMALVMNPDWFLKGKYFGYPLCCISEFILTTGYTAIDRRKTVEQEKVHGNKGFIPCPDCAKTLVDTGQGVETLLKNRVCPTKFGDGAQIDRIRASKYVDAELLKGHILCLEDFADTLIK